MTIKTAARTAHPTERGETTRRHILAVAGEALLSRGYAATSLNDVIRAAGVTKGAFYHHFPSKEALALEVVRTRQTEWATRVVQASLGQRYAVDQLRAMAAALCDLKEEHHQQGGGMQLLCAELSEDRTLAPQLVAPYSIWIDTTAAVVARAQAEGGIRSDVDARRVAELLVAAVMGIEQQSALASRSQDFRQRITACVDLLLQLLAPAGED
jgi:AcrR family transcriptional regulator